MDADPRLVVVDASVAVKWFVAEGESGVDAAKKLLEDHAEGRVRLVAPALLAHELLSVLARGSHRSRPPLPEAMDAFFDSDVSLVAADRRTMTGAARLVGELGVSPFDAAYAALAETLGCDLATVDRKLARKVGSRVGTRLV